MINAIISNGEHPTIFEAILRKIGMLKPQEFLDRMVKNPGSVPLGYIAPNAIVSAVEYDRLNEIGRAQEANQHLQVALALTHHLYEHEGHDNVIFPALYLQEGTTESGALGTVMDPNREYGRDQPYYLLKRVDESRGRQVVDDARSFKRKHYNINLESILANIPIGDGHSYLWKRFIPGPNLGDLFRTLDRGISGGSMIDGVLLTQLEKELKGIAIRGLRYWQINAPNLLEQPRDPEAIIRDYKRNLVKVLEAFSERTDTSFSADDKFNFVNALDNINWRFMNDRKVMRNLAATYRNMIILTGKINIDYPRFIEQFTQNGGKRKPNTWALERELYFIDWSNKYSHPLEEAWEMDLSLEGTAKKNAVKAILQYHEGQKLKFTQEEILLMGIYRAYRKAYLVLTQFIPKTSEQLAKEQINEFEYEEKQRRNQMYIDHLLAQGNLLLQKWEKATDGPAEPVSVVVSTLGRLSSYTRINYKK